MRIQRYILGELLAAFALIALIITGVIFAAMLLQFLHRYQELNLMTVLGAAPYIIPQAFPITLPLSFLVACLLTYGRFSDDNEFLALQMGGIHPWHAASPAVATAAILAVATVLLNTDVIPFASLAQAEIARGEVREIVKAIADPGREGLSLRGFQMSWHGRDERGLKDVLITLTAADPDRPGERKTQVIQASRGRVDTSRLGEDRFYLDLDDVHATAGTGAAVTRIHAENQLIALSIDQLVGQPPSLDAKDSDQMSASQLFYKARTLRAIGGKDPGVKELALQRKYEMEYWRRIAMGLAPLAFSFVGVGLGLAGGKGSRTAAFMTAILIALPVYFPLILVGANLARHGILPAGVAMNLGNALLIGFGLWRFGRVVG